MVTMLLYLNYVIQLCCLICVKFQLISVDNSEDILNFKTCDNAGGFHGCHHINNHIAHVRCPFKENILDAIKACNLQYNFSI